MAFTAKSSGSSSGGIGLGLPKMRKLKFFSLGRKRSRTNSLPERLEEEEDSSGGAESGGRLSCSDGLAGGRRGGTTIKPPAGKRSSSDPFNNGKPFNNNQPLLFQDAQANAKYYRKTGMNLPSFRVSVCCHIFDVVFFLFLHFISFLL